jgi:PAS domain S-box-containing protein
LFGLQEMKRAGFENVIQHMPAGVIIVKGSSGKILTSNKQAQQMTEQNLGWSMASELGDLLDLYESGDFEILHPDGRRYQMEELPLTRSIRSAEEVRGEEMIHLLADGSRVRVRCDSSPIYDDEGKRVAGMGVFYDITERKRAEEQITYYKQLKEDMHDAFIAMDERLLVKAWNKGAERMYGWTADEALGRDAREVVSLEMSDEELAEALQEIEQTGRLRVEQIQHHRDGTPFHIDSLTIAMQDEQSETTGYLAINRDITDRKRLETEQQRLVEIVQRSSDFIGISDLEGRAIFVNEAGQELVGLNGIEEVRSTMVPDYLMPEDRAFAWDVLFPTVLEQGRYVGEYAFRHFKTGEPIPVQWDVYRLDDPSTGEPINFATITRDITERKQAEEGLREAKRRLEELAVLKAEFTAMVAHELDTPLAVISGYADLLAGGKAGSSDESRSHALAKIQTEIEMLKALVADVRAAATVEREAFAIEPQRIPVGTLLQEATEFATTLPGDHPLTIENAAAEERVWADPHRIGQVLRNLLVNAAKYSPDDAPIELRVKPGETDARVLIEVVDRGAGIHPDDVSRIFEKFGRGRDGSGRKMAGAGLGLYLSRRIMLAHGGELKLKAAPGDGSVFFFELRCSR